MIKMLL